MKTKEEIIKYMNDHGKQVCGKVKMKIEDHTKNPLAPEPYCYKLYFDNENGERVKYAVWPETVGYQWFK